MCFTGRADKKEGGAVNNWNVIGKRPICDLRKRTLLQLQIIGTDL